MSRSVADTLSRAIENAATDLGRPDFYPAHFSAQENYDAIQELKFQFAVMMEKIEWLTLKIEARQTRLKKLPPSPKPLSPTTTPKSHNPKL
jgi:hypothetical protein